MNKTTIIIVAGVLLLLGGGVIFWAVTTGAWEELWLEPPPKVDYSGTESADEIITLEYERFREMHESGKRYDMHPRARAILEDFSMIDSEVEFRLRVTRELYEILASQAEAFRDAHPELWKLQSRQASEDNREHSSANVAPLPYTLGSKDEIESAMRCEFVRHVKRHRGENFSSTVKPPLDNDAIQGQEEAIEEYLERTAFVLENLENALAKEQVVFPTSTGIDPDGVVPFPFPHNWYPAMQLRVQSQLLLGRHEQVRRELFAMFELLERANVSQGLIGAIVRVVVMTDRFIYQFITPCAQHGALTADELDDLYRRGKNVGFKFGRSALSATLYEIWQFLSPTWKEREATGSEGLPNFMFDNYGKTGIGEWFRLLETERPKRLEKLEGELDALQNGEYVVKTEEDLIRCAKLCDEVLDPVIDGNLKPNLVDMFLSQQRWLEVKMRALEARQGKPFRSWSEFPEELKEWKGLKPIRGPGYIDFMADDDYFIPRGIEVDRDEPEFRVRLFRH